jgi:hypothetical protein
MKTLSGTVGFVVLAVIAIVALLGLRAFATGSTKTAFVDKKFRLKIGLNKDDYAEVTDDNAFKAALARFPKDQYDIRFKPDHGPVIDHYQPVSIKTDKVTTSEVAKSAPAGEAAANDPHYTQRVTSDNPTDIKAVLATFK